MLVDDAAALEFSWIQAIIAQGKPSRRLATGLYEIGHFGSTDFLREYEHYARELSQHCYGVCDSPAQLLERCPELQASPRKFLVTFNKLERAEEPPEGGWRWHKWGPYIGDQEPTCEYLAHEPKIERVWVYHIYERVAPKEGKALD